MEKVLTVKEWIQKKKYDEIAHYIRTSPEVKSSYDSFMDSVGNYGISSRSRGEAIVDSVTGEIKVKADSVVEEINVRVNFIHTSSERIQEESVSFKPNKQ